MFGSSVVVATAPVAAQTPAPVAQAAGPKFAVIDVRRAVSETEQGLRVQATLKKLFDARQNELESKQRQIQSDKETLEKEAQQGKISKDVLAKKYETLQRSAAEFQNITVEYQREMQRKETEMTTPILQGILEAVKRIAAQEGFEMVLEKSSVPYFRGDLELTDRAIQIYNGNQGAKGAPSTGGKAPDAKAPAAAPKTTAPAPTPKK